LTISPGRYPTFIKPDKKITVADLLDVHRTFYEGTPYDLTQGVAAGPFGNPDRFKTQGITKVGGAWERSIGLFRTTQAHVLQARSGLPKGQGGVVWFGPHAAHGSCFVPLTVGMTALPISHTTSDPRKIDRASAYWAHKCVERARAARAPLSRCVLRRRAHVLRSPFSRLLSLFFFDRYVINMAHLRYKEMYADISDFRKPLVANSIALLKKLDANALAAAALGPEALARAGDDATAQLIANAVAITKQWWTLPDTLMWRYADNFFKNDAPMAYPDTWLQDPEVGYTTGPPPPPKEPNMKMV
jgi:hypothetical protein